MPDKKCLYKGWIEPAETMFLPFVWDKFQSKHENIDKVYQSGYLCCIINLTHGITFLCNIFLQTQYTPKHPIRYSFLLALRYKNFSH